MPCNAQDRRYTPCALELETREDGARRLTGYASVFHRAGDPGTEYELWDGVVERVATGAFDRALAERDDVRALLNHQESQLLGRTSAGTLRLTADQRGLRYVIDLPDTQLARDVAELVGRGDLTGSSFAFRPDVVRWEQEDDRAVRYIESVRLADVGPVTYPAYEATTANMRSARAEYDHWRESCRGVADVAHQAIQIRLKLLDV